MLIKFDKEFLPECFDEAIKLAQSHWSETEDYRADQPFTPNKERYTQLNKSGHLHIYTARDLDAQNKLVGVILMKVGMSLHTGVKTASEDQVFLLPEYRNSGTASKFLSFVENDLKRQGVGVIMQVAKLNKHSSAPLLRRSGYEQVGELYLKKFPENYKE